MEHMFFIEVSIFNKSLTNNILCFKSNVFDLKLKLLIYLTVCFCHVTYAFQSESTLYSCLNVKELLAWSRRQIWRWSDCDWTRTQNHLVLKRTLNHLAKLAMGVCLRVVSVSRISVRLWLSVRLRTKWFLGLSPVAVTIRFILASRNYTNCILKIFFHVVHLRQYLGNI